MEGIEGLFVEEFRIGELGAHEGLGPLVGGILTARIGGGDTLFWVGVGLLAVACIGATSGSLRNFRGVGDENF